MLSLIHISLLQIERRTAHLVYAFSGHHQVDQVMVAHTGPPGVPRQTALMTAVEDGKFHVVGIALLVGLLEQVCHVLHPKGCCGTGRCVYETGA